jgi:DMSO/TMAO reductase YedYZ molybdopterin-dependent catalytic subunit
MGIRKDQEDNSPQGQQKGEPLPKKYGFALRAVGEGYYGFNWAKYVYKMTVQKR